jgi:hypothetical protein
LDVLIENQSLIKEIYAAIGGKGNPIEKFEELTNAMQPNGQEGQQQCIKRVTVISDRMDFRNSGAGTTPPS